jgi:hypothetical protein
MRYQKPDIARLAGVTGASCENGSSPSNASCTSGASVGGTHYACKVGIEAIGSITGCTTGEAAGNRCAVGHCPTSTKSACATGGTAATCTTGSTVTG